MLFSLAKSPAFRRISLFVAANLLLVTCAPAIDAVGKDLNRALRRWAVYDYNDAGALDLIDYDTGTDTDFGYDDAGRLISMVDGSGTTEWEYDDASQLTDFDSPQGDVDYSYFDDGQLETMTNVGVGDTDFTYDEDTGQLLSIINHNSETTSFDYDDLGRLEKKTFHTGVYELYGYDERNRLLSIDVKNSSHSP